ncbi:ribbon-helix-helix domain-containing protein [Microbacterium album]|uniref:CopG family transcriptional regulator n=1 Tax=Microbacterium album TaxID=2053191 RepID=A0A917MLK0_9MICO|nr:ribbon-helix-helix domain-containing protein [Microbacterium album]GGH43173.1 hypothetical protein GCM10010921_16890 [Microbacterium album]
MATMNVSLPDHLKEYVEERVGAEHYTSASEYDSAPSPVTTHRNDRLRSVAVTVGFEP